MSTATKLEDKCAKITNAFLFLHWRHWNPTDFVLTSSIDQATEKKKNDTPMTYINIRWGGCGKRRLIIITPKMDMFGISRGKDQNNKELDTDTWKFKWRLKNDIETYDDPDQALFHKKLEEFDTELLRQIDELNQKDYATKKQKNPNYKGIIPQRLFKGLIRIPEKETAEYMSTTCSLQFDKENEWLRDFTVIQVDMPGSQWEKTPAEDLLLERYTKHPNVYKFKYCPLADADDILKGRQNAPGKDEYINLIPPYSSAVNYIEISSISFNTMMYVAAPKIHRCLYFNEPRSMVMNTDLYDHEDMVDAPAAAAVPTVVESIDPFGGSMLSLKRKAEELTAAEESLEDITPPAKQTKVEEPAPVPVVSAAAAPVEETATAVKVSSSLGSSKPSGGSSSSSSSSKPSGSSSSSSSSSSKPSGSSSSSSKTSSSGGSSSSSSKK